MNILCIPNFSEGRRESVVREIVEAISTSGAQVMDWSMDRDHNRSVIGFFGSSEQIGEAVLAGAQSAMKLIDLGSHAGRHPRFGAMDVVPFIPLSSTTMQDAIDLSVSCAKRIGGELEIPTYLYEQSAADDYRRNLAAVRRLGALGQTAVLVGDTGPDFGPNRFHSTAGAVAVGARGPLIAYNVNLATDDVSIARRVAAKIRETRDSGAGMAGVKAIGLLLDSQSISQVSTNITLPVQCSARDVFEFVEREAGALGVSVRESELIGIASRQHLSNKDISTMKFTKLRDSQFLESWNQNYSAVDCE